jgi:predicted kinase
MLCGKIASGKSTLAGRLAAEPSTIRLSEDHFLAKLHPDETVVTLEGFVRRSSRLRDALGPHIEALLRAGVSVVLDFHANTEESRAWMRGLYEAADAGHMLHYLDVADEVCLERLHLRNATGEHAYVSDQDFAIFTSYFVPPAGTEGFNVRRISQT